MATTLTSKGQVTVPKAVRDLLGLGPGSRLTWELGEDGRVFIAKVGGRAVARSAPRDRFARVRGSADGGMTTDEIMALMRGDD